MLDCFTIAHTYLYKRHAFGPSCTEFVYPECCHFDDGASSKIDDVLAENGGLLDVLPLTVHLKLFLMDKYGGPFRNFFIF